MKRSETTHRCPFCRAGVAVTRDTISHERPPCAGYLATDRTAFLAALDKAQAARRVR